MGIKPGVRDLPICALPTTVGDFRIEIPDDYRPRYDADPLLVIDKGLPKFCFAGRVINESFAELGLNMGTILLFTAPGKQSTLDGTLVASTDGMAVLVQKKKADTTVLGVLAGTLVLGATERVYRFVPNPSLLIQPEKPTLAKKRKGRN